MSNVSDFGNRVSPFDPRYSALDTSNSALGTRHSALLAGFLLFFVSIVSIPARAQAWTMPKGEAYVKVFYGEVTAAEMYTFDGRTTDYINGLPGDTYRDRSLYLYSEVGITDHVTLVVTVPYKRTFVRDQAFRFRIFGLGSIAVGARAALLPLLGITPRGSALSVNVTAYVPTGYTRNFTPSTGAGQIDFQGSLFFGQSLYPLPAYAQVGIGYRHRSSMYFLSHEAPCVMGSDIHCITDPHTSYGDEMVFHAEAGVTPFNGLILLQAIGTGVWSLSEPHVGFSALNPLPTRQRMLKVGAGVALYPFPLFKVPQFASLGFSVQYFRTPYGRNTINSRDIFVGVEYRPKFFKASSR